MTRSSSISTALWLQSIYRGDHDAFTPSEPAASPITWAELGAAVAFACDHLQRFGVTKGDTIASWMPNSLSWIALDLACQTIGICHAAVDFREPAAKAVQLAEVVSARALIQSGNSDCELDLVVDDLRGKVSEVTTDRLPALASKELAEFLRRASNSFATSSPVQILFTSGSTGDRKAVQLSEQNLYRNARAKLDAAPQNASDLRLNILPFTHAYARTCELSTWILTGGQLAVAGHWDEFVRRAPTLRPTLVNCVPFLAQRIATILESTPDALGGRLRLIQVGGAALPEALFRRLERLGLPPICGYGMTEASPVVCSGRAGLQRPGTIGYPVSGVDIRIDARSQLFLRGSGVMLGYLGDDHDVPVDDDGWLATGDLAAIRGDGHVVMLGRKSQQIVLSTGYNVDPGLVESRLTLSGLVKHCLVLGNGESQLRALVTFDEQNDSQQCTKKGSQPQDTSSRASFDAQAAILKSQFSQLFADLPRHAIPAKIQPFPIEILSDSSLLTAKGTLRRNLVLKALRSHPSK